MIPHVAFHGVADHSIDRVLGWVMVLVVTDLVLAPLPRLAQNGLVFSLFIALPTWVVRTVMLAFEIIREHIEVASDEEREHKHHVAEQRGPLEPELRPNPRPTASRSSCRRADARRSRH